MKTKITLSKKRLSHKHLPKFNKKFLNLKRGSNEVNCSRESRCFSPQNFFSQKLFGLLIWNYNSLNGFKRLINADICSSPHFTRLLSENQRIFVLLANKIILLISIKIIFIGSANLQYPRWLAFLKQLWTYFGFFSIEIYYNL